jgi:hypothetical protein
MRRSPAFVYAPLLASVLADDDVAALSWGALPGVSIQDVNGNSVYYDEMLTPGDDDAGYVSLRTWPSRDGVYINRPRIKCPVGSDFQIAPFSRVMNLAVELLIAYLETRLNKGVLVDRKTGYILKSAAGEIERGGRSAVLSVMGTKPMISDFNFAVNRTQNLLTNPNLACRAGVIPKAYIEGITLVAEFVNPVRVVAV